ncbi:MAG: phosphate acyltransferase PlsX [Oscillospiraceae bacterium]|nr:phosphate acyltransferase PlsX [Oscillospiraceae bacterium]MBQ1767800.1 phosphate acyltransferase PlsX [Oscillospiraceae bacterium]MBQ2057233.1 phosphate acyltransferase PlsX [Oscillospiraceae bacterium]MBQ2158184.1 phosphate acyltransferase PlsX [Oscillospiraceae bacterium]MBQ2230528.1 phosphate acyltransferase PlsX [Oscillospiraceae bacterium]
MKLIIDCLGGDNSPRANVEAAVLAMQKYPDLNLILTGGEKDLLSELNRLGFTDTSRVEIVHAPDAITGDDKPTDAIRLKKESSMMKAISILRTDESVAGLVSTGATGALVAAATLRIGRIRGIRRPAFCPILPTMKGGIVGLCDSGANVDIIPDQLREFAIMGSRYLETVFDIKNPRVAMLNVGTEREKGDDLRKTAYPLLENEPSINFVGNMESRDLLTGKYDLVVCDGFSGNVLTKTTEGTALEMLKMIKRDIQKSWKYKLGALLMKKMLMAEKNFMDYQNYGGSVLLGSEKVIVKGHGSSDASSVLKCIEQAYRMELSGLNDKIMESIKEEANV